MGLSALPNNLTRFQPVGPHSAAFWALLNSFHSAVWVIMVLLLSILIEVRFSFPLNCSISDDGVDFCYVLRF